MSKRRAGTLQVSGNGQRWDMMGEWNYNLGLPKRSTIAGPDRVHGFKEEPQPAFIEGKILDKGSLNMKELVSAEDLTVVLELARGPDGPQKTIMLSSAWFASEGTAGANSAEIDARFESDKEGEEIV